ncbi:MAG: hypothetical protein JRI38_05360 [Deltaproteobacteria bacterium]|nr:hypothetical protein [Deltaproteobacteria bacterium]
MAAKNQFIRTPGQPGKIRNPEHRPAVWKDIEILNGLIGRCDWNKGEVSRLIGINRNQSDGCLKNM